MDNGQNGQNLSDAIVFDPNQSVNTKNTPEATAFPAPPEHDSRSIGNKAIGARIDDGVEISSRNLGVVTEIGPQQKLTKEQVAAEATNIEKIINLNSITRDTVRDCVKPETVGELKKLEHEVGEGEVSVADFVSALQRSRVKYRSQYDGEEKAA